ncbi:MAG: FtsX-like permease family protein [Actinomycetota bacterium]
MSGMLRELRRAPARILTSVLALALAIGAIGVLAVPAVAASSLRAAGERDQIPQLVLTTTELGDDALAALAAEYEQRDDVIALEGQMATAIDVPDAGVVEVVGVDIGNQRVDVIDLDTGRLPATSGEVIASTRLVEAADVAVGDSIALANAGSNGAASTTIDVVGIGNSSYWTAEPVAFVALDDARAIAGSDGYNRVVLTSPSSSTDDLRALADELRADLGAAGVTVTTLPEVIPAGQHPIEEDITQVSVMIGFLGIVAGIVALVLLASTTNTLITERTREAAVMGALGARPRALRRRLRRIAMTIAIAGLLIGIPLGIAVANVIARLVLQEFVGVTPGLAVSIPVIVGSVLFALIGARLVSARAARRVTKAPLAESLRDRDGNPFGRRWSERLLARVRVGGLRARIATRNGWHRRARSVAIAAQITAAIAALMIVASMATTINDFNAAESEPWNWQSQTVVAGSGLDIDRSIADDRSEVAIDTIGLYDDWEIDVRGLAADTEMIDRQVTVGAWFADDRDAVVSEGFASRVGIDVGDRIEVEVASGTTSYDVVGLHRERGRSVFVPTATLATDLGQPEAGNVLFSLDEEPAATPDGIVITDRFTDLTDDEASRNAILLIFGAIGVVVVSVAGLAVASGLAVSVYERRHQVAAMQAIGARRGDIRRIVLGELLPLAAIGIAAGLALGYVGALGIARSFEAADAVEIGFTYATGAIPVAVAVVLFGCVALAAVVVRQVGRRTLAETLRTS